MKNSTIKKLDTIAPVLHFGNSEERAWSYLWQGLGILSIATVALNVTLTSPNPLTIIILFAGVITMVVSIIGFFYDRYADERRYSATERRDILIRNIRKAAKKSIDNPEKEVLLSNFVINGVYGWGEKEYVASLSSRHIRWIKSQHKKQLKAITFERTDAKLILSNELDANTRALNEGTETKEQARATAYYLKALEDVASGKERPLSEVERFDLELSRA